MDLATVAIQTLPPSLTPHAPSPVGQALQELDAHLGASHNGLGVTVKHCGDETAVVWLSVADNDVVDLAAYGGLTRGRRAAQGTISAAGTRLRQPGLFVCGVADVTAHAGQRESLRRQQG